jgi:hypothetical protein
MLKKADFLWLLAYPLYQCIGSLRHEASHAVVGWLEGATITAFVFWPTLDQHWGVGWGYVGFSGPRSWLTSAAPYAADLSTFGLFFWLCMRVRFPCRWLWLNAVIVGLISPLVNTAYNYRGAPGGTNDVGYLLQVLPPLAVHAYFALTMVLYGMGIWVVSKRAPR